MTRPAASLLDSDERLRRYAELAVRVGANVQSGQEVAILCQVEHASILHMNAESWQVPPS